MEQKKASPHRRVDTLAADVSSNWRKTLIYVTKKQVSTWKGLMVIFFAFGILAGVIWSISVNIETKSKAAVGFAKLTWNANTESDLAGYKVYYGTAPRTGTCPANGGYASMLDVGNVTTTSIPDLIEGKTYYFSVTAYDTSKNESCFSGEQSKSIPVTTIVDSEAPVVAIAAPTAGTTVSGTIMVNATASDNIGITKVEVYVDNSLKSTMTASPYTLSFDTTTLSDGSHTLLAKAYDAIGNRGISSSVAVTVKNTVTPPPPPATTDTTAPTVTMVSPVDGATVSGTVGIKASATDNVAVTNMICFVDGKQVSSVANLGTVTYSWNTKKASAGPHIIKIDAKDAAGNTGTTSITVTVGASTGGGGGKPVR